MKASDLRIGNLVNYQVGTSVFQDKVTAITEKRVVIGNVALKHACLQPIPLTEEWLLKFGFKFSIDTWYLKGFAIWETECGDEKGNEYMGFFYELREVGMMDREIKYVHELQNLHFALTGEEL